MASKSDRPPEEQEHQKKAFEIYYAMGTRRSYQRAADQVGVSASTIKLWSRLFGWRQRIKERDADVARQVADRGLQSSVEQGSRNLKIVQVALMKVAKAIAAGQVRVQMGDLDRLIRLEEHLASVNDFDREAYEWYKQFDWIRQENDPERLRQLIRESYRNFSDTTEDQTGQPPPDTEEENSEVTTDSEAALPSPDKTDE